MIVRTVLWCTMKHNCAQSYAHLYEQFLQINCFRYRFCVCSVLLLESVYLC